MQIDGWAGQNISIDQETVNLLSPGEFLFRDYENVSHQQPPITLFIDYSPSQKTGDQIHSERDHCLPAAGWVPTLREVVEIARSDGSSFTVNRFVVSKAGDRELVLDWYQAHGRAVASEYWAKYYLIADSIRMNRADGALVQLMTPMNGGESPDVAQARLMRLGSRLLPMSTVTFRGDLGQPIVDVNRRYHSLTGGQ